MPMCMVCSQPIDEFDVAGTLFDGDACIGWIHEDCAGE